MGQRPRAAAVGESEEAGFTGPTTGDGLGRAATRKDRIRVQARRAVSADVSLRDDAFPIHGERFLFFGGLHHAQAADGGAGTVANGDGGGFSGAEVFDELFDLGIVAFFGEHFFLSAADGTGSGEAFEIFGLDAHALHEHFDEFTAGGAAADGAVGQVADGAIGKDERSDHVVFADRILFAGWE